MRTAIRSPVGSDPVAIALRVPQDVFDHPGRQVLRLRFYSAAGRSTTFNSRVKKPTRKVSSL
jgi:hypothetical protein